MNIQLIELIISRLYPLVLGQYVEQNIIGIMNSLLYNPIPIETWNIVYDHLLRNRNFTKHENGRLFLRWKPRNMEEYHYRISQCTNYMWILDQKNVSHYRDEALDVFFE